MENKGRAMMIVIIALLTVLILTICGVSFYVLTTIKSSQTPTNTSAVSQGKVLTASEIFTYELTAPIAVNLAVGTDGQQHSASVEVGIGIDNTDKKNSPTFITLIQSQEVVVRDAVISVLRTKTVEEMSQLDSQEAIKQEILEKLRAEFNSDLIYSVYFGTFYYD